MGCSSSILFAAQSVNLFLFLNLFCESVFNLVGPPRADRAVEYHVDLFEGST